MQPNLSEQLAGIRRILEEVVAPAIDDGYVVSQLHATTGLIALLERQWHRVIPLLMQENDELGTLFADLRAHLPDAAQSLEGGALYQRIVSAAADLPHGSTDYPSFQELEARNRELRALLAETIQALEAIPSSRELEALRGRIRDQLRSGLERALS